MSGFFTTPGITPPSLSYLTIYNPTLQTSEDNEIDQILYFYQRHEGSDGNAHLKDNNQKLKHVGLAQGIVQFASGLSNGQCVDHVETEKARIIIRDLEYGQWWLLASVDLTCIISTQKQQIGPESAKGNTNLKVEYSAREVSPPDLIAQQLIRAHRIFLLHHGTSLSELWDRVQRDSFCTFLKSFWDAFLLNWEPLIHANPSAELYNGVRVYTGGELGAGSESGGGEREVLEGFVTRTKGLIDVLVSRFDTLPKVLPVPFNNSAGAESNTNKTDHQSSDGIVFSGTGALTRGSVRNVTSWVEWIAKYGVEAYGILDNPSSNPRRIRLRHQKRESLEQTAKDRNNYGPPIPASIVGTKSSSTKTRTSADNRPGPETATATTPASKANDLSEEPGMGAEMVKYLTLGVYGSTWGIPAGRPSQAAKLAQDVNGKSRDEKGDAKKQSSSDLAGYFLVGLRGALEERRDWEDEVEGDDDKSTARHRSDQRVSVRHVYITRAKGTPSKGNASLQGTAETVSEPHEGAHERARVIVYVQSPFIITFLFEQQTDSLAMPSFYHSLHHQLGPLRGPLLRSTDPNETLRHLWSGSSAEQGAPTQTPEPIYNLVYDPHRLSVHTTIPNIPPLASSSEGRSDRGEIWSRSEALAVHSQMLNMLASRRRQKLELERTCKTHRGWWVVWMRLPPSVDTKDTNGLREAFLVRKASDYKASRARKSGSSALGFSFGLGGSREPGASSSWGSGRLAEGIGVDARQYIESLLSLTR